MKKQIKAKNDSGVKIEYYIRVKNKTSLYWYILKFILGCKKIDKLYASCNCMKIYS